MQATLSPDIFGMHVTHVIEIIKRDNHVKAWLVSTYFERVRVGLHPSLTLSPTLLYIHPSPSSTMGYKARNKQPDPTPLIGSDAFRDPRNARSARKGNKRKADEVGVSGSGVGKKRKDGKGKGKGREEIEESEDEALQPG